MYGDYFKLQLFIEKQDLKILVLTVVELFLNDQKKHQLNRDYNRVANDLTVLEVLYGHLIIRRSIGVFMSNLLSSLVGKMRVTIKNDFFCNFLAKKVISNKALLFLPGLSRRICLKVEI